MHDQAMEMIKACGLAPWPTQSGWNKMNLLPSEQTKAKIPAIAQIGLQPKVQHRQQKLSLQKLTSTDSHRTS